MAAAAVPVLTTLGVSAGTAATIGTVLSVASTTVLSVASTVATIGSTFFKGRAEQTDYSAQIAASNYNAQTNKENAAIVASQTAAEEETAKRQAYLRRGANVARAGANTGSLSGSVLDILMDNTAQEELDILNIRNQGMLRQRGLLTQSNLDTMTANTTKSVAKQSNAASILSGVANIGQTVSNSILR